MWGFKLSGGQLGTDGQRTDYSTFTTAVCLETGGLRQRVSITAKPMGTFGDGGHPSASNVILFVGGQPADYFFVQRQLLELFLFHNR